MFQAPGYDGISNDANAVRIRECDRTFEKAGFFDPRCSRHFAVSVQTEPAGVDRIPIIFASRKDRRNSRAHRTFAHFECAIAGDQSRAADFNTFYIGDAIEPARRSIEGHAESSRTYWTAVYSLRRKQEAQRDSTVGCNDGT